MTKMIHAFEESGLGKAPFEFVNLFMRETNCQHCGTPILYNCVIEDVNGKQFIVGNVCVHKTGDEGLHRVVDQKIVEFKRKRDMERAGKAKETYLNMRDHFEEQPHPCKGKNKFFDNMTLADYFDWMFKNGSLSGKIRISRIIEKTLKELNECNV